MKIDELQEFLIILEDIATYCHMTVDEKDFSNKIKIIKDFKWRIVIYSRIVYNISMD